eukprot:326628-Pyramimonas_sp.AAC.1
MPGVIMDYWREPMRKEDDGRRGPADLISVERLSGSATVRSQSQALLFPCRMRGHVLSTRRAGSIESDFDRANESRADKKQVDLNNMLMDIVVGEPPGKLRWIGKIYKGDGYLSISYQ